MSAVDFPNSSASDGSAKPMVHPAMPAGVIIGGPLVQAKLFESRILVGIFFAGSAAGILWAVLQGVSWVEWSLFAIMYSITTIGIGVGVHRMLVHRSFRCGLVLKFALCAAGQMACQGSLLKWVGNHRRHHLYADHVGDPHSPYLDGKGFSFATKLKGWLHAHNGWLFDDTITDNSVYAKDMLSDPMVMFFTRTRWFWYMLSMVIIPAAWGYAFAGLAGLLGTVLFAGFLRAYLMVMSSVAVGSVCHRLGYRRFRETKDESTNELLMTLVTFGEGLHNNHHRFPRDAYISHSWYELDLNGLLIRGLAKIGLVHDVVDASRLHKDRAEGSMNEAV